MAVRTNKGLIPTGKFQMAGKTTLVPAQTMTTPALVRVTNTPGPAMTIPTIFTPAPAMATTLRPPASRPGNINMAKSARPPQTPRQYAKPTPQPRQTQYRPTQQQTQQFQQQYGKRRGGSATQQGSSDGRWYGDWYWYDGQWYGPWPGDRENEGGENGGGENEGGGIPEEGEEETTFERPPDTVETAEGTGTLRPGYLD